MLTNPFAKFAALADLAGTDCALNHGANPPRPAVDYLVIPMGYKSPDGVTETITDYLLIPVCDICAGMLYHHLDEWLLLYCVRCHSSSWVRRAKHPRLAAAAGDDM